ncbi:MAG: hypothetical protein HYW07_10405 [Candidatus Latescibacteria bacterium]|nr:hypothetical protein [Candidatus Latescibacterota bacterium]
MGSFSWLLPPLIASLVAIAMLGLAIRSILFYSRRAAEIRRKLKSMDREIARWHEGTADKQKVVVELQRMVTPLQEKESRLQSYYKMLEVLSLGEGGKPLAQETAEKRDVKAGSAHQQQEEKPKRKLEINLKKRRGL